MVNPHSEENSRLTDGQQQGMIPDPMATKWDLMPTDDPDLWAHRSIIRPGQSPVTAWYRPAVEDPPNIDNTVDTYTCVGLIRADRRPSHKQRAKLYDIVALGATAWLDVDIACEWHKKQGLPADIGTALEYVNSFGAKPSYIYKTGGGIQAFWVPPEIIPYPNSDLRALSARWRATARTMAGRMNISVDSVYNLDRLMRTPGSYHTKAEQQIELIEATGLTWSIEEFSDYCLDISEPLTGDTAETYHKLSNQISEIATVPIESVRAVLPLLFATSPASRHEQEHGPKVIYPSHSEADFGFACAFIKANQANPDMAVSAEEIIQYIKACALGRGARSKPDSYYIRTYTGALHRVETAAQQPKRNEIHRAAVTEALETLETETRPLTKADRYAKLNLLLSPSQANGQPIVQIQRIIRTQPVGAAARDEIYTIYYGGDTLATYDTFPVEGLTAQALNHSLYSAYGVFMPAETKKEFYLVLNFIFKTAELCYGAAEMTPATDVASILKQIFGEEIDIIASGVKRLDSEGRERSWRNPKDPNKLRISMTYIRSSLHSQGHKIGAVTKVLQTMGITPASFHYKDPQEETKPITRRAIEIEIEENNASD